MKKIQGMLEVIKEQVESESKAARSYLEMVLSYMENTLEQVEKSDITKEELIKREKETQKMLRKLSSEYLNTEGGE